MRFADRMGCMVLCAIAAGGCGSLRGSLQAPAPAAAAASVPAAAQARYSQALELIEAGDARAERELLGLSREFPALAGPSVNLGLLYTRSGRLEEAEAAFQEAVTRNPQSAVAHNGLGIVYRRTGRFGEASASYGRAIEAAPGYAPAYLNRGVLNDLYLQRPDVALTDYERYQSLRAVPDEQVAHWIHDLRLRIESAQRTAQSEAP